MNEQNTVSDKHIFLGAKYTEKGMPSFAEKSFVEAIESDINERTSRNTSEEDQPTVEYNALALVDFIPKPNFDFKNYFSKTQKWLGHIIEIKGETFMAKLEDITNGGTYEIAEFDLEEVSQEDQELMALGAVFYWGVGYENRNGQVIKQSLIRFQRLPKWDQEDMDEALDRASRLNSLSNWN